MTINIIAALDENYGLGYNGDLLFKIKHDLNNFKQLTSHNEYGLKNYLVMGRRTYLSLPFKPTNRKFVVLTRDESFKVDDDVIVSHSLENIINHYKSGEQQKELFLIGGQEVFKEGLKYADKIYLTKIYAKAEKVDTYFPYLEMIKEFEVVDHESHIEDGLEFAYITYERKNK